ncbi:hypothetical protein [Deminuibacter soli]|uniref:hypothetical protein n=1 Tax=Deminuibacter soli TaxID=2291815 RepID=UPI00131416D1|nr:hypothetical protein [Deminuibacter soli]
MTAQDDVFAFAERYYGINIKAATQLGGYSNRNLLVTTTGNRQYVMRIATAAVAPLPAA